MVFHKSQDVMCQFNTPLHGTSHHITPHRIASHYITSHRMTAFDNTSHHSTYSASHDMTWLANNHITSPHFTSPHNQLHYFSSPRNHNTMPRHITSQHTTSPPPTHHRNTTNHHQKTATKRNGWRLVCSKNSGTFCMQILSLAYRFFPPCCHTYRLWRPLPRWVFYFK